MMTTTKTATTAMMTVVASGGARSTTYYKFHFYWYPIFYTQRPSQFQFTATNVKFLAEKTVWLQINMDQHQKFFNKISGNFSTNWAFYWGKSICALWSLLSLLSLLCLPHISHFAISMRLKWRREKAKKSTRNILCKKTLKTDTFCSMKVNSKKRLYVCVCVCKCILVSNFW